MKKQSFVRVRGLSIGTEDTVYPMLKYHLVVAPLHFLDILNDIWIKEVFPRPGLVTQLRRTNFEVEHPRSRRRPASKIMEWVVDRRLVNFLEQRASSTIDNTLSQPVRPGILRLFTPCSPRNDENLIPQSHRAKRKNFWTKKVSLLAEVNQLLEETSGIYPWSGSTGMEANAAICWF